MVLLVVGLDTYDGYWQGLWVDGHIPSKSFLRERAAKQLEKKGESDMVRRGLMDQLFGQGAYTRDKAFVEFMDNEWWGHKNDLGEVPYYMLFRNIKRSSFPALHEEYELDGRKKDYRAMVAVRRSREHAWDEALARQSLHESGFAIKESDYTNQEAHEKDAKRLVHEIMSHWIYPCFHARNALIRAGFRADYVEGLDLGHSRVLKPWVEDYKKCLSNTQAGRAESNSYPSPS